MNDLRYEKYIEQFDTIKGNIAQLPDSKIMDSSLLNLDILSKEGIILELWNSFSKNMSCSNIIHKCIESNIINKLSLSNDECLNTIKSLHEVSIDLESNNDSLSNFIKVLDSLVCEYANIKNKQTNINYNINDNIINPTYQDESIILCSLLENSLIDSTEVQDLLDNQSLELSSTAHDLIIMCSGSDPSLPRDKEHGVNNTSAMKISDFGTDESKILECVEFLTNEDIDLFPNSIDEICKTIFPREDFDEQVLYNSQANYMSNLANYGMISATAKYIEDSFDLDSESAIYVLSQILNTLKGFISKYDKQICLILYMATALVLNKKINEIDRFNECGLSNSIKKELFNALLMYKNCSVASKNNNSIMMYGIPKEISQYIQKSGCDSDMDELRQLVKDSFDEVISSMNELEGIAKYYGIDSLLNPDTVTDDAVVGPADSKSSRKVEPVGSKVPGGNNNSYFGKIEEMAKVLHTELNNSLLDNDYECAASIIACESVLLNKASDENLGCYSVMESLKRDVLTYGEFVEVNSSGISQYIEDAKFEISNALVR